MAVHHSSRAAELAEALATRALSVCRRYLPNGHRQGNYWVVGNARNAPGRSTYVRLFADGRGHSAGRWTDAATGEYGDLLDIIRAALPGRNFGEVLDEAETFIGRNAVPRWPRFRADKPRPANADFALKLFQTAIPIKGTLAEAYLLNRGINPLVAPGLRFLSHGYCRPETLGARSNWPTLIAATTDPHGTLTGIHRLFLDPDGWTDYRLGKAPLLQPKRSLGHIQSHAVRFGEPAALVVVAEGLENALSLRTAFPGLTVHAALSAGNLMVYAPLPSTRRLLIALDNDDAGRRAAQLLEDRASRQGLRVEYLRPRTADHNLDLRTFGLLAYRASLADRIEALIAGTEHAFEGPAPCHLEQALSGPPVANVPSGP